MSKTFSPIDLWGHLSQFTSADSISFADILNHFEINESQHDYAENSAAIRNSLQKMENNGTLVVVGVSDPKIILQDDLPSEVSVKFNAPKQEDKAPNVVLYDRSLMKRKTDGKKFQPINITLDSDLSVEELRLIDKAEAYVFRNADGAYVATIKEVTAQRSPKPIAEEQDNESPRKVRNAANKESIVTDILNENGISHSFDEDALAQARELIEKYKDQSITLEESPARRDLRHLKMVTIDGERTRIRDDAVYAEEDTDPNNKGGHKLYVAISDVEHFIRPDTPLDIEAKKRGTSHYFKTMNVPMFPQELAEDVLSLDPHKDRAVNMVELKISADGEILDHQEYEALINSKAALHHEQLTHAIVGNSDKHTAPLMDDVIPALSAVSDNLAKNAQLRGMVDYDLAEPFSEHDYTALPHSIVRYAMQAAQAAIGRRLDDKDNGIYRVQDAPYKINTESVEKLIEMGLLDEGEITAAEDVTATTLNALFAKARSADNRSHVKSLIKDLMPQSKYSTENKGHFSLAEAAYAPFTSPIRNYAHILTSRRLKADFSDAANYIKKIDFSTLDKDLERLTQTSLRAKSAMKKINEQLAHAEVFSAAAMKKAMDDANALNDLFEGQDIETAILRHMDIPYEFPDEVMAEIDSIMAKYSNPEDLLNDPHFEDLTALPFVTIDGADARDFDDAVYCHPDDEGDNAGGHILWVAIADVSFYVKPDTAIDIEARKRGNSVYFPKKVIPMLPEELSNNLCSLRPDEHRATMAYRMKIDKNGNIISHTRHEGIIKSRARLTYNEVLDSFDGKMSAKVAPIYDDLIVPLNKVSKALEAAAIERGAISFDVEQLSIHVVGEDDCPEFREIQEDDARGLIAQCMIAMNMCTAKDQKTCKSGVYRVHEDPKAGNMEALETLKALGIISHSQIQEGIDKSPKSIQTLIKKAEECSDPDLAKHMIIRLQAAAKYSTENVGHFGLQIPQSVGYSHSTSPIRRYPDLLVHRNIKDHYGMAKDMMPQQHRKDLNAFCKTCSETERRADRAAKKVSEQYCMRYLNKLEGQILEAKIVHVGDRGLKIRLKDLDLETYLGFNMLPKGSYDLNTRQQALVNNDTGHVFPTGYTIKVMIEPADRGELAMPVFHLANPDHMRSPDLQSKFIGNGGLSVTPKTP
ncbi:MAG: RNB domain-containing ribonuclease [Alphaproteobacteria bacterium]|nr:RNB domain-containing ribonuclease [Alphaproteobacteria bacterium]